MTNEEAKTELFKLLGYYINTSRDITDISKPTTAVNIAIEALNSQKLGEWVKFKDENGYTKFMCSNCRFTRGRDKPKYCPNCGSNNRSAKNDR